MKPEAELPLASALAQLERIAATRERILHELEHGSAERQKELMQALTDVPQAVDKIERAQYG